MNRPKLMLARDEKGVPYDTLKVGETFMCTPDDSHIWIRTEVGDISLKDGYRTPHYNGALLVYKVQCTITAEYV